MKSRFSGEHGATLAVVVFVTSVLIVGMLILVWWVGMQDRTGAMLRYRQAATRTLQYALERILWTQNREHTQPRWLLDPQHWARLPDGREVLTGLDWDLPREIPSLSRPDIVVARKRITSTPPELIIDIAVRVRRIRVQGTATLYPLDLDFFSAALGPASSGSFNFAPPSTKGVRFAVLNPTFIPEMQVLNGELWTDEVSIGAPEPSAFVQRTIPPWPSLEAWFPQEPWKQATLQEGTCGSGKGLSLTGPNGMPGQDKFWNQDTQRWVIDLSALDLCDLYHPMYHNQVLEPWASTPNLLFNGVVWIEGPTTLRGQLDWSCLGTQGLSTLWILTDGRFPLEIELPAGIAPHEEGSTSPSLTIFHPGSLILRTHPAMPADLFAHLFAAGPVRLENAWGEVLNVYGSISLDGALEVPVPVALHNPLTLPPLSPGTPCLAYHWLWTAKLELPDFDFSPQ